MKPFGRLVALALLGSGAPLTAPVVAAAQTPARVASSGGAPAADDPARDSAITKLTAFLTRYPDSPLRPNALFELGELLVRRADAEFEAQLRATTGDTTRAGEAPVRPVYEPAIARYDELVRRYPNFPQVDAGAYTLGTLLFRVQRYADATRMFELVTTKDSSRFRPEAFFRLGDSYFEVASRERGPARQAAFVKAAAAYERAVSLAPPGGDIYFLSLYKLGWSYYNQATRANQEEYRRAVDVFGRLVAEYDKLSPEQQARLGLRKEAIEYMAIAFTQVGGAQAAQQFAQRNLGQRIESDVGLSEVEPRGEWIGDGDAGDAGALGRHHTVRRVLQGDRLARRHTGRLQHRQIEGGVGLHALDVVGAPQDFEVVAESETSEVTVDPGAARRGGDRESQSERPRRRQVVGDAGKHRLARDERVGGSAMARVQGGEVERTAAQSLQVIAGIEGIGGADALGPPLERQRVPVLVVDGLPGVVDGRFSVEDQTVEVEDEQPHQVRMKGRAASRPNG
jgi:tetratricopeptide (TPR) repeat protein